MIAKEGRPGPVLIDIQKDVTANKAEFTAQEPKVVKPSENICEKEIGKCSTYDPGSQRNHIYLSVAERYYREPAKNYEFVKKVDIRLPIP